MAMIAQKITDCLMLVAERLLNGFQRMKNAFFQSAGEDSA
jgi:hypothetical protein